RRTRSPARPRRGAARLAPAAHRSATPARSHRRRRRGRSTAAQRTSADAPRANRRSHRRTVVVGRRDRPRGAAPRVHGARASTAPAGGGAGTAAMAWVTWRQHRLQLVVGAGLIGAVALSLLISGLPIRTAYHRHALATCLPPTTRSGCDLIVHHFTSEFANSVRAVRYLALLPAFIGVFVGAPLLAREFEQGTFRLAWTQT